VENARGPFSFPANSDERRARQGASADALREALAALAQGGAQAGNLSPEALAALAQAGGTQGADLARLLGARAGAGGAAADTPQGPQYLVFAVGDLECALPTDAVQGVERLVDVTPVPNTVDWVLGVMQLRGSIVSVVDLRRFLGLPPVAPSPRTRLVVAAHRGMAIALAVDAVLEMRTGGSGGRPLSGARLPEPLAPYVAGSVEVDGRPVPLVDPQRLLFADKIRQYRSDVS
jgi:purine-binding chemotaxis protein CheW